MYLLKRIIEKNIGVISFVIAMLFFCFFNQFIVVMRSLPDELGAVALGAYCAGYDWSSVLSNPPMFYGSGMFPLIYLAFSFVQDPIILYRCLLGIAAFLRALPAFFIVPILQYYVKDKISAWTKLLIIVICCLVSPVRTTNIDNESLLILLTWICVYLLFKLSICTQKKKFRRYSIILGILCGYAYFTHTRGIIYVFSIITLAIIMWLVLRKSVINIPVFFTSASLSLVFAFIANNTISSILYNPDLIGESEELIISNTPNSLLLSLTNNVSRFFSIDGIQSFLDLFCGNIWIIFVFSIGLIPIAINLWCSQCWNLLKDKNKEEHIFLIPVSFCMIGFFGTLLGLCIHSLSIGLAVHLYGSNLSRFHFYLRYYGNYLAPMILYFIIFLILKKEKIAQVLPITWLLNLVAIVYFYFSALCPTIINNNYSYLVDWFYHFAPLGFSFDSWPNAMQGRVYFFLPTAIVFFFCFFLYGICKKGTYLRPYFLVIILLVECWTYGYNVLLFDKPFSNSENYYLSVNALYKEYQEGNLQTYIPPQIPVAYVNSTYGPEYLVQFLLKDNRVDWETDIKDVDIEDYKVIISNESLNSLTSSFNHKRLDNNEYIYYKE